jgi:hypothetical protein
VLLIYESGIAFAGREKYIGPKRGNATGSAFFHILTVIRSANPAKRFVTFTLRFVTNLTPAGTYILTVIRSANPAKRFVTFTSRFVTNLTPAGTYKVLCPEI